MPLHRTQATPRAKTRRQSVRTAPPPVETDEENRPEDRGDRILIVGVGAFAGGLEAFTLLLKHMPVDTGRGLRAGAASGPGA